MCYAIYIFMHVHAMFSHDCVFRMIVSYPTLLTTNPEVQHDGTRNPGPGIGVGALFDGGLPRRNG